MFEEKGPKLISVEEWKKKIDKDVTSVTVYISCNSYDRLPDAKAWTVLLVSGEHKCAISGVETSKDIRRSLVNAALAALRCVPGKTEVRLETYSKYLKQLIEIRFLDPTRNTFVRRNGKVLRNCDVLLPLRDLCNSRVVYVSLYPKDDNFKLCSTLLNKPAPPEFIPKPKNILDEYKAVLDINNAEGKRAVNAWMREVDRYTPLQISIGTCCSYNKGSCTWAAVIVSDEHVVNLTGGRVKANAAVILLDAIQSVFKMIPNGRSAVLHVDNKTLYPSLVKWVGEKDGVPKSTKARKTIKYGCLWKSVLKYTEYKRVLVELGLSKPNHDFCLDLAKRAKTQFDNIRKLLAGKKSKMAVKHAAAKAKRTCRTECKNMMEDAKKL